MTELSVVHSCFNADQCEGPPTEASAAAPPPRKQRLVGPALVQPEPLLRALTDPRLQDRIDPGHQRRSVSMRLAAALQRQRRKDRDAEAYAVKSLNPERQHVAVEAERQNSERWRGHRRAAKEWHRDAVIHFLVRKQAQMLPAVQRRNRTTCSYCALRNEFAAIASEPRDHAVHQWIVKGTIDLGN